MAWYILSLSIFCDASFTYFSITVFSSLLSASSPATLSSSMARLASPCSEPAKAAQRLMVPDGRILF